MDIILNCTYFFQDARGCNSLYTAFPLPFPFILFLCLLLFLVKENKMHFKYVLIFVKHLLVQEDLEGKPAINNNLYLRQNVIHLIYNDSNIFGQV